MRTFSLVSLFVSLPLLTACPSLSGGSDTASDTGFEVAAPDRGDFGGVGGNDGDRLTQLIDPCQGQGTPNAVLFADDDDGWLGCGDGMGLWRSTDGGGSWSPGHPSTDLDLFDLSWTPSGDLLACGHDHEEAADDALLYRYDGTDWTALLYRGTNEKYSAAAWLTDCGQVAAAGDGTMLVASNSSPDLTWSEDDGQTWASANRYWEDHNLEEGDPVTYTMSQLTSAGGRYFGAGRTRVEPPSFFGPSLDEHGAWYNFHAWPVSEDILGEVGALGTPDEGGTWFVGGRDRGPVRRASGFFFRSDDQGQSWTEISLPGGADALRDIAFSADGKRGVAVGVRFPSSDGGYVLLTDDGGRSWTLLDEAVPVLESTAAADDLYWIAGDNFVARGSF